MHRDLRPAHGATGPERIAEIRLHARGGVVIEIERQQLDALLAHAQIREQRANADVLGGNDLRDVRDLGPERTWKVELERFRVGVHADIHLRHRFRHVTVELHRDVDTRRAPHGNTKHGAVDADIARVACLLNSVAGIERGRAAEERHAAANRIDQRLHVRLLFGERQRRALAERAERQDAVDTGVDKAVSGARGLVEIHRVGGAPVLGAGFRRGRHDRPRAAHVGGGHQVTFSHHWISCRWLRSRFLWP